MKTKFILSSGYAGRPNKKNDKFFKEILSIKKNKLKVLLVYFAKTFEDYERITNEDKYQFNKNKGEKELVFEIAKKDKFANQIKSADIVYLHGGKTLRLLKTLKSYKNLKKLFNSKVVAGESAGAYVLSTCFYSKSEGGVFKGLGFVPVKTICHYVGQNAEKLKNCPDNLEILFLPDYKFKVYYS